MDYMASRTWNINSLDSIAGNPVIKLGEPAVIRTKQGQAVQFDGINDGLIVKANPIGDALSFTIEVVFRPDSSFPKNKEQRFIHFQNPDNENRRVLIETRLTQDNKWFLDTFIMSEQSSRTLYAKQHLHPIGRWYHAALVYENNTMKHYVNGLEEMSGEVDYLPIEGGNTSIGVRMNQVYWFKGAIQMLKVTPRALSPAEFTFQNTEKNDES
ncbi:LamG domain-containing protein [candidate division KSB1 bacterium]|nr:LamG domain-containing protein [candidate division KSB1 bacterium]